ncbi:MAG: hypothetical protein M3R59_03225 [Verrucomicrobiota bacterium]|nr:hypothetical protein [Verrucomicrobiota bacterium]
MSSALRALLSGAIDYAGLFPPASLSLDAAMKNYARDVRTDDAWMLSSFVLPVAKFAEARRFFADFDDEHPLRVSALGPKTKTEAEFLAELEKMRPADLEGAQIAQLEMPLPGDFSEQSLRGAREILGDVPAFWETTPADSERTIALLAQTNDAASGYKLRTGGVTPEAFPTSAQIATALVACASTNVPIKFTAGLHHPVRLFREEVKTKMHGFLNVLGAGVLAREWQWDVAQTTAMLDDEESASFVIDGDIFRWREFEIANIQKQRAFVTSFGSCSFDEPRADLRALHLL